MPTPKVLDLDALIEFDETPVHTRKIKLFKQEWTMVCDVNAMAISDVVSGDPAALVRFFDSIIVDEERVAFRTAMTRVPNLDAETLLAIFSQLMEAAGERPTKPPSSSSGGATTKPPPRKSVASTSRTTARR